MKNLNLLLPKDGIKEKMTPHADLIFPRPWNPIEGKDLCSRVWVRGEGEKRARARAEHGSGEGREWLGEREE